jgi:hypothetical protein
MYPRSSRGVGTAPRLADRLPAGARRIVRILATATVRSLERIKSWFGRAGGELEGPVRSTEPVATPPAGGMGEPERETSTNAQMQGSRDEPWPDEG